MELTPAYLKEQDDVIKKNFDIRNTNRKLKEVLNRLKFIHDFCEGAKTILSVGCGPLEPIELNATHASDVSALSEKYLKEGGWKGEFRVCSCDDLSYANNWFDVAVCSEVIEHLPELEAIKKTFLELNRVSKKWIVTTPATKGGDPTHKRVFNFELLEQMTSGLKCKIERRGNYWYIFCDGK